MQLRRLTLVCALSSTLAACGGGGGSSPSSSNSSNSGIPPQPSITVSGVASKGLIRNAIVNVYAYDAAGNRSSTPILSTRSSATDGSYALNLGARTGLFTVEVSGDASTTMDDEYSGTIPMPAGMTLRSLVQLDANSNSTVNAYVTPFTDMVVAAASSAHPSGGLTANNVAAAQSEVTKILGFNPLTTRPVNSNSDAAAASSDAAEKLQSIALAAISGIAHHNALGCSGTDSAKIKCAVSATTAATTMKDNVLSIAAPAKAALLASLTEAAQDPVVNKTTLKTLDGQKLFSDLRVSGGAPAPTPAPAPLPAPAPAVAEAKSFFASLRTNLKAWSPSGDTGGLRHSLDTIEADFNAAVAPLDQSLADWVVVSGDGIKLFNAFAKGKSTATTVGNLSDNSSLGACTLYKDSAAQFPMTPADAGSAPQSVSCILNKKTLAGSEHASATPGHFLRDQITRVITLVRNGSAGFTYSASTQRETQKYQKNGSGAPVNASTQSSALVGSTATGSISYTMSGNALSQALIEGAMPARVDDSGAALTDREIWNISYRVSDESNGISRYAFSGAISALKNGASLGAVNVYDGSYARVSNSNGQYRMVSGLLSIGATAGNSTIKGALALDRFTADRHGNRYLPTFAQFIGSFTNTRGEFYQGTLTLNAYNYSSLDSTAPQSASNYAIGSVAFSGELSLTGLRPLAVTFAARNTGYKVAEYNGTYYDGANFIFFDGNNSLPLTVNLFSSTGIALKWVDNERFLDVFKNNSKVALINVSTKVINYADGSFETLR